MKKMNVLDVLKAGHYIRMIDGRYQFGFVDVAAVNELVKDGNAELFDNHGVTMARIKRGNHATDNAGKGATE